MGKQITVDFYEVQSPSDFGNALTTIWKMKNEDARTYQFTDAPVRLRNLETKDNLICGDMIRIRLGEPAFLAKLRGGERPVTQDDDEGLGETNAFIYCPQMKHIAFQRNRSGVSASKMAYYVEQKNHFGNAIIFNPVLAKVAINQLLGKAPPKRLTFRVSAKMLTPESAHNAALSEMIDAAHKMQSAEMEVTFSMARQKGGMNKENVINFAKNLLRLRDAGHNVKTLEIAAPDEGSRKSELYDFIDATLKSVQTVEPSPLIDEFYHRRLACVRAAWEANWAKLE